MIAVKRKAVNRVITESQWVAWRLVYTVGGFRSSRTNTPMLYHLHPEGDRKTFCGINHESGFSQMHFPPEGVRLCGKCVAGAETQCITPPVLS